MIVSRTEIEQEKSKIILRTKQLQDSVNEFCYAIAEVEEVIAGLKVVANTCGGHARIDKITEIANIEFNQSKIKSINNDVESITVLYDPVKKYL